MSSEFQRIAEARLIHHRFASVGFRQCVGEPMHVKSDLVAQRGMTRAMRNAMVAATAQRSGNVGEVLPGSPSALGCFRLLLLLVFSTSASLEETWIG